MKSIILAATILAAAADALTAPDVEDQDDLSFYTGCIYDVEFTGLGRDLSSLLHKRAYEIEGVDDPESSSRSLHRRAYLRNCANSYGTDGKQPCRNTFLQDPGDSKKFCEDSCRKLYDRFKRQRIRAERPEFNGRPRHTHCLQCHGKIDEKKRMGTRFCQNPCYKKYLSENKPEEAPDAMSPAQDPNSPDINWDEFVDFCAYDGTPASSEHGMEEAQGPNSPDINWSEFVNFRAYDGTPASSQHGASGPSGSSLSNAGGQHGRN